MTDSASFHANVQRNFPSNFGRGRGERNDQVGRGRGDRHDQFGRGRGDGQRSNFFCKFCNRTGNTEDRCWKKHGLPPHMQNSKFKGEGVAAYAQGDDADDQNGGDCLEHESGGLIPGFTNEQCSHFLSYLNKNLQLSSGISNMALNNENRASSSGVSFANFAGPCNEEATGTW